MRSLFRRYPWLLFGAILTAILIIGVALAWIGAAMSPLRSADFWSDFAKAGLQIAIITVLGAIVTATLKYVDERRGRDEQRLKVFRDILLAYNQVKAVRRNLRALGMLERPDFLNATQAQGLREQMMALNDAQLSLEAVKRELAESRLFKDSAGMILQLTTAEYYLSKVHERWEEHGGWIWDGADVNAVDKLELVEFVGHKGAGYLNFEEHVSTPLDCLARALHAELFGKPTLAHDGASLWRRWIDLWNGDLTQAKETIHPEFTLHRIPRPRIFDQVDGREGLLEWIRETHTLFKHLHFTAAVGPIVRGEMATGRWIAEGTHQGGIPGSTAPVGTNARFHGNDIWRTEKGLIREYWMSDDLLDMTRQVGTTPR